MTLPLLVLTPALALDGAVVFRDGPASTGVPCAGCHNQGGYGGAGPTATFLQTPSLFGLASLESVPDEAILAAAAVRRPWYRVVEGVVGYTADGEIGRFGWRAEGATLDEVVTGGCRSGPVTPDEAAALSAWIADRPAPAVQTDTPGMAHGYGLFVAVGCADCHLPRLGELTGAYTDLLLHDLGPLGKGPAAAPATLLYRPGDPDVYQQARRPNEWRTPPLWGLRDSAPYLHDGRGSEVFAATGCTDCHARRLGDLEGAYTDLLLHDMGGVLRSAAAGRGSVYANGRAPAVAVRTEGPATASEWKTPPLWGLRDTAPYLHDGRATTIDAAILAHSGEGHEAARRYVGLTELQRGELMAFLATL